MTGAEPRGQGQVFMETTSLSFMLLASAYLLTNALGMVAYVPQIWSVCRDPDARSQVVTLTWWVWTVGGITELFYAVLVARQWTWGLIALAHAAACGAVAIMGSWEKYHRWRQRQTAPTEAQEAWS